MTPPSIPFALLDTVFLDAGNTLFSMDFELMSEQLALLGPQCAPDRLARAEAAARPAVSARIAAGGSTESPDAFRFYLQKLLERSAAVLYTLGRLGGVWRLLAALGRGVPPRLRDALYDAVAATRYRVFGTKTEACPLLPPALRQRFDT